MRYLAKMFSKNPSHRLDVRRHSRVNGATKPNGNCLSDDLILSLTPAARMSPNREANRVATRAVIPSIVSVAVCKRPNTDDRAEAATTDISSEVGVTATPSVDAVARDIGKQGKVLKRVVFGASLTKTWDSAHGDGACESVMDTKTKNTPGATCARSPFFAFV